MIKKQKGFTLVELVIVMAVVALILSIAIPNFRAMQQEGELTKAEGDLNTLRVAVTSYWRNNSRTFPTNIHSVLTATSPTVISATLSDPWTTDATNGTYGYTQATDASFGSYFIIYTKGPKGDTSPTWDTTNDRVTYTGTGRVVSNAPIVKQ